MDGFYPEHLTEKSQALYQKVRSWAEPRGDVTLIGGWAVYELTVRRLELLIQLKRVGPEIDGIRRLSRVLDRDVKNVSQDVQALAQLGLLDVQEQGPGRPHIVSLPGQRIDLHLVEGGYTSSYGIQDVEREVELLDPDEG